MTGWAFLWRHAWSVLQFSFLCHPLVFPSSALLHKRVTFATVVRMKAPKTPRTAVAARIRARRKARDQRLHEVAFATGISSSVLCRIELGDREPRFSELEKIATALSCTVRDLIPPRRVA